MNNKGLIISILAVVLFGVIGLVVYVLTSKENNKDKQITAVMSEKTVSSQGSLGGIAGTILGLVI
jgi:uncharacterized membrane protein YsdA (DUF1294 family)